MFKYKKRLIEKKLKELFAHYPVVAVLGARQVGKSTLVENLFSDVINTIVFDPVVDIGNARQDPDFFIQNIKTPAFLDEIQYAPELLGSIKRKVDKKKQNSLFLVTGNPICKLILNGMCAKLRILGHCKLMVALLPF